MWTVVYEQPFKEWYRNLSADEKYDILAMIEVLEAKGPHLGRPYVDTLKGSQLKNLKELRIQHQGYPYRVLFVFDPLRQAILLCGGNKTNDKRFYERMIPIAQNSYQQYLTTLENKNG